MALVNALRSTVRASLTERFDRVCPQHFPVLNGQSVQTLGAEKRHNVKSHRRLVCGGGQRTEVGLEPHQDFQIGEVLRVSCPQTQARVAHVSRFYASVEWPWAQIDPEPQFKWNGQRAFAVSAHSSDWTMSLFKTTPEPWNLRVGDSCLVGIPETLVRIIDIGHYDPPQDVGWLPRPHTMLVVVPADYPDEALSEDDGDTIDLDSAAPLAIELVSRD